MADLKFIGINVPGVTTQRQADPVNDALLMSNYRPSGGFTPMLIEPVADTTSANQTIIRILDGPGGSNVLDVTMNNLATKFVGTFTGDWDVSEDLDVGGRITVTEIWSDNAVDFSYARALLLDPSTSPTIGSDGSASIYVGTGTATPNTTGFSAPAGSLILGVDGSLWLKTGALDTDWELVALAASVAASLDTIVAGPPFDNDVTVPTANRLVFRDGAGTFSGSDTLLELSRTSAAGVGLAVSMSASSDAGISVTHSGSGPAVDLTQDGASVEIAVWRSGIGASNQRMTLTRTGVLTANADETSDSGLGGAPAASNQLLLATSGGGVATLGLLTSAGDPSSGSGIQANQGSLAMASNGVLYVKEGALATDWASVQTSTSWPSLAPDGSAVAPSYSFANSPGTGAFLSSPTSLGVSVDGAQVAEFSDGVASNAGGVHTFVDFSGDASALNTAGDGFTLISGNVQDSLAGATGDKRVISLSVDGIPVWEVDETGTLVTGIVGGSSVTLQSAYDGGGEAIVLAAATPVAITTSGVGQDGITVTDNVDTTSIRGNQIVLPDGSLAAPALAFGSLGGNDGITLHGSSVAIVYNATRMMRVSNVGVHLESQARFSDGTFGAPGVAFDLEPTTGIYRPAANQIGFALGGTSKVLFESTGQIIARNDSSVGMILSPGGALTDGVGWDGNIYVVDGGVRVFTFSLGSSSQAVATLAGGSGEVRFGGESWMVKRVDDAIQVHSSGSVAASFLHTLDSATGDEVAHDLTAVVNKATSGNYTALRLNVTEMNAPGGDDRLWDIKVGGTSFWTVDNTGTLINGIVPGSATTTTLQQAYDNGSTVSVTAAGGTLDLLNSGDATDVLSISRTFAGGGRGIDIEMGVGATGEAIRVVQRTGGGLLVDAQHVGAGGSFGVSIQDSVNDDNVDLTVVGLEGYGTNLTLDISTRTPGTAGQAARDIRVRGGNGAAGDGVTAGGAGADITLAPGNGGANGGAGAGAEGVLHLQDANATVARISGGQMRLVDGTLAVPGLSQINDPDTGLLALESISAGVKGTAFAVSGVLGPLITDITNPGVAVQLQVPAGTAAVPSFVIDQFRTGFYAPSGGEVAHVVEDNAGTGSVEIWRSGVDASDNPQLLVPSGLVSRPSLALGVVGTGFYYDGATIKQIGIVADGNEVLRAIYDGGAGTTQLRAMSLGSTSRPTYSFNAQATSGLFFNTSGPALAAGVGVSMTFTSGRIVSPDTTDLWTLGSDTLRFKNAFLGAGTVGAPSLSVGAATDGLYHPAASQLGLVANGEAVIVDNDSATPIFRPDQNVVWNLGDPSFLWARAYFGSGTEAAPSIAMGTASTGFYVAGGIRVSVSGVGRFQFSTGAFAPLATNTYDLGGSTLVFRRGYFGAGTAAAPAVSVGEAGTGAYLAGAGALGFAVSGASELFLVNDQLRAVAGGSALAPFYSFDLDRDCGLYNPALNQLGLAANGEAVIVDNDAVTPSFRPDAHNTWALGEDAMRWAVTYSEIVKTGAGSAGSAAVRVSQNDIGLIRPAVDQLGLTVASETVIVDNDGVIPSFRPDVNNTWTLGESALRWSAAWSAQYWADAGAKNAPSYSILNNSDVGMYLESTNVLGLAANAEAVLVDNDSAVPSFRPDVDNTWTLGEEIFRWANVYATTTTIGDLNMFSLHDNGKWTLNEDERGIYAHNRLTGKSYRIVLEEIADAPEPLPLKG